MQLLKTINIKKGNDNMTFLTETVQPLSLINLATDPFPLQNAFSRKLLELGR